MHHHTNESEYSLQNIEYAPLVFSLVMCIPASVVGGLACSLRYDDMTYEGNVAYCSESVLYLSNQPHVGPGMIASILQGLLRGCVKIVFKLQQEEATSWNGLKSTAHPKKHDDIRFKGESHFSAFLPCIGGEDSPMAIVDVCLVSICRLIECHGPMLQSTKSLTVDMLRDLSNEVSVVSEGHADSYIVRSVLSMEIACYLLLN